MKVRIDAYAWLQKADLSVPQLQALKAKLTIVPKKHVDYDDGSDNSPIELFRETDTEIGIAREYFLINRKPEHEIEWAVSEGNLSTWPGAIQTDPKYRPRPEQEEALVAVATAFRTGALGGIIRASCGWGKTLVGSFMVSTLNCPTVVVVHKEFLMDQWAEKLEEYMPGIKIGFAQQKRCDFEGKHVVIGMVHSLAKGHYPEAFYRWPKLVITDECHRIGARTWAPVPGMFPAKYRLALSATPRRKDGTENVFFHHIGPILFNAKEQRMLPQIKRVHSQFKLVHTPGFNPRLAPETLILRFLCANEQRNRKLVELMVEAVRAGRKILVLSKIIKHLNKLEAMFKREWKDQNLGNVPTTGYLIGGMSEEARDKSSFARAIFATSQLVSEGLDVPALDTCFLTAPMADVEQSAGRILRPYEGKKNPMIVDMRDDLVPVYKAYAASRDKLYKRLGWG